MTPQVIFTATYQQVIVVHKLNQQMIDTMLPAQSYWSFRWVSIGFVTHLSNVPQQSGFITSSISLMNYFHQSGES